MGHKVHPIGFRLKVSKDWNACWYAEKKLFVKYLLEDIKIRKYLKKRLASASVSRINIERQAGRLQIIVYSARRGIVIGKKGEGIDALVKELKKLIHIDAQKNDDIRIIVEDIRKPELDAQLVAESVAQQLERRVAFRRAMKRAVSNAISLGAKGVKIRVAGRLGGAEIARSEWYLEGQMPLSTLRADLDYALAEAKTTYGVIGIKVWIYKGELLDPFNTVKIS